MKKLGRWAEKKDIQKTCFPGSTMLYKNLKTFNHSKCVKTFPIILKCGLFIIYKSIIREFKSKPYAVTVSSFPLKHWGRGSKNWGRISFQLWLLHAHCITLTAKCWMNHSHRFCFPPLFVHSQFAFITMCFVGHWIKVSVWSVTVRLAFFHSVKPQHITFSWKNKTRQ